MGKILGEQLNSSLKKMHTQPKRKEGKGGRKQGEREEGEKEGGKKEERKEGKMEKNEILIQMKRTNVWPPRGER